MLQYQPVPTASLRARAAELQPMGEATDACSSDGLFIIVHVNSCNRAEAHRNQRRATESRPPVQSLHKRESQPIEKNDTPAGKANNRSSSSRCNSIYRRLA